MQAEYVVVTCLVAVGATLAIVALGLPLLRLMLFQQAIVCAPFP